MNFSPRATNIIKGIIKVLESGAFIDHAFIVRRFEEGGYAHHLAVRNADQLIWLNARRVPGHWASWATFGTIPGQETYSLTADALNLARSFA